MDEMPRRAEAVLEDAVWGMAVTRSKRMTAILKRHAVLQQPVAPLAAMPIRHISRTTYTNKYYL
jgi:hypothetical protein